MKIRVFDKRYHTYLSPIKVGNMLWDALNSKDYILEQFTGLQDKNGKDIYVGDIVKCIVATHKTDENLHKYILGEIVFVNLVGKFMLKTTDNNHYDFREMQTNVKLEVIGNINPYKTPHQELLDLGWVEIEKHYYRNKNGVKIFFYEKNKTYTFEDYQNGYSEIGLQLAKILVRYLEELE